MIRARLAHLWAHHRALLLVFCVAICAVGFFGVRTLRDAIYWNDPAHWDRPVEGWMTPRYISLSYKIPPRPLAEALFIDRDAPFKRQNLSQIAEANGVTLTELQDRIDAAVESWRLSNPEPARD